MDRTRRRFLRGGALAAVATAGCLQVDDGDGGGGGADGGGEIDPTSARIEQPRIDEPSYTIVEQSDDADEWNQLYLCEYMPPGTDLEFQMVSAPRLADPLLPSENQRGDEYAVRVLASEEAVHEVFETDEASADDGTEGTEASGEEGTQGTAEDDGTDDSGGSGDDATPTPDRSGDDATPAPGGREDGGTSEVDGESEVPIAETDFEENVLLVVESGYVSGSMTHHWERVRTTDEGFRLQGCYEVPYERTGDATARHSVVRVERPEDFEYARVSLTTSQDERVHFNSTEGVVAVEKDV